MIIAFIGSFLYINRIDVETKKKEEPGILKKRQNFLYHCRDDEKVPISYLNRYMENISRATFHEISGG